MPTTPRKLRRSLRTAVLLSACLAVTALTTGLLLTVHVGNAGGHENHESQDCSLCRQLSILSKKLMLDPVDEFACDVRVFRVDEPQPAPCAQDHDPQTFRPRAPPSRS
jgi:hypothetical protein